MSAKIIYIFFILFGSIAFFLFKSNKGSMAVNHKAEYFKFDSSWYHKVEDSLFEAVKDGKAESGKLYIINGHKFRWTIY